MRIWAFPFMYPYDYPGMSWAGIFAHRQYKGLIENGADLKVILPVSWSPAYPFSLLHPEWKESAQMNYPHKRVYDGVTVYHPRIANFRPNRFVKKTYEQRYIDSIVDFFRNNNITLNRSDDIFYSQWLPGSVFVQQAAHQLGVKSATLGIGDDVIVWPGGRHANFLSFEKLEVEADLRFFNADYLGREMNKILGRNLHYDVVYFGIDYDVFRPASHAEIVRIKKEYNFPLDKVIILIIGTALKRKGWLDLFDAVQEIKKTNDNFVLAGGHAGSSDIDVNAEVTTRGINPNFINLGEIKPADLSKLYNAADIFCLPSHWEGLATVVIEAMSSGLPVITTNVCGHPEIINSGVTGILVPTKQPTILAKELILLIDNKEKRDYLGKNARNFIVNDWGDFAYNAVKLYKKMEEALVE